MIEAGVAVKRKFQRCGNVAILKDSRYINVIALSEKQMEERMGEMEAKFCWSDLTTTNIEQAKDFYSKLLGWSWTENSMPSGSYFVATMDSQPVAGLGKAQEGTRHSYWNTYFSTSDLEASVARAEELGGTVLMPAMPLEGHGEMAVLKDPSEAVLSLWKSGEEPSKSDYCLEREGFFCWTEMLTNNLEDSGRFYCELFKWTPEPVTDSPHDYFLFKNNEHPVAGMMEIQEEWGEVPPCWSSYVFVRDLEEKQGLIRANGGEVLMGPQEIPNMGRFLTFRDPTGSTLCLFSES